MKQVLSLFILIFFSLSIFSQVNIEGKITDKDSNALQYATVFLNSTYYQSISSIDGSYFLDRVPKGTYTLVIESFGKKTIKKEIIVEDKDLTFNFQLLPLVFVNEGAIIEATRNQSDAGAHHQVKKEELQKVDFGQDMPFLLDQTPSVVVTSDAGAGVGYTGIRLRGSDATRINVTINGIPLNDSESHGVYWVDIPDISGSTENIQIQRGVGSSTHGAGAFGGSINVLTTGVNSKPYSKYSGAFGSFNTMKNSISFGTGLINEQWSMDGRLSTINSDGFIDRASSELKSYYLSAGYFKNKTLIKAIVFGGFERTYQAWNGVPEAKFNNDTEALQTHIDNNGYNFQETQNLLNSNADTYNVYTYKNQVDNYNQDHAQLHVSHEVSDHISMTGALHYTYGRGYYEQFKSEEDLSDYGLSPISTASEESDLIRRKWLENEFYGFTGSVHYKKSKYNLIIGGALNKYDGYHFGKVIWAQQAVESTYNHLYYFNNGEKTDGNIFTKLTYKINNKLSVTGDIQWRKINYEVDGIDEDRADLFIDKSFSFLNPKVSINYNINTKSKAFLYVGRANREPVRSDFVDALEGENPKPEQLTDYEIGFQNKGLKHNFQLTGYYMDYKNQLILTGELNNVGTPIRINTEGSYRTGLELEFAYKFSSFFTWKLNGSMSRNKINSHSETLYDYTTGFDIIETKHDDTDISFSPNLIIGNSFDFFFLKNFNISLISKFVGDQYLDNTSNDNRKIDSYFINDGIINYKKTFSGKTEFNIGFKVSNILNVHYASNGYTYSYIYGDTITENFYYPQAGRNFMMKIGIGF